MMAQLLYISITIDILDCIVHAEEISTLDVPFESLPSKETT